jgi:hypothetical protein
MHCFSLQKVDAQGTSEVIYHHDKHFLWPVIRQTNTRFNNSVQTCHHFSSQAWRVSNPNSVFWFALLPVSMVLWYHFSRHQWRGFGAANACEITAELQACIVAFIYFEV